MTSAELTKQLAEASLAKEKALGEADSIHKEHRKQIIAAHTAEVAELSKAIKAAVKAEIKEAKKPS